MIGEGGSGVVYECVREGSSGEPHVAIKVLNDALSAEPEVVARFEREAAVAKRIESAHVVRVHEFGRDGDRPYLVMELVRGRDLGALLAGPRLPVERAVRLVRQVLVGLEAVHATGAVYRDLKPENVLVEAGPGGECAKLVDFGMSKEASSLAFTEPGIVLGTPAYVAPEQARGAEADARADVYSAGAVLFECLTGRTPHVAPNAQAMLVAVATTKAPDVRAFAPRLPRALAGIVNRALAAPAERYPSARAMELALARLEPFTDASRPWRWLYGAVALLVGALATAWWLTR